MKRQVSIFAVYLALSGALLAGCAGKTDAEIMAELKPTLAANCKSGAASAKNMPPETIQQYCDCSADKAVTELGGARIREIADGDTLSASDQQVLQRAGMNCAVEILQKMLLEKSASGG